MLFSKQTRLFIASATCIAMLLCYSLGIAHATYLASQPPADVTMSAPCHGMGEQSHSSSEQDSCSGNCQAATEAADFLIFDWTDAPIVIVDTVPQLSVPGTARSQPNILRLKPPPHSVLHCCLRS